MHRFLGLGLLVLGLLTPSAYAQTDASGGCPQLTGWFSCASDGGEPYYISYQRSVGSDGVVKYTESYSEPQQDGSRKAWPDQIFPVGSTVIKPP